MQMRTLCGCHRPFRSFWGHWSELLKTFCFIILAAVAFVSGQTLDDSYTLGYITAPFVRLDTKLNTQQGIYTDSSVARLRVGHPGSWSLELPVRYNSRSVDDSNAYNYGFPGLRLAIHPAEGCLFDLNVGSGNMWYAKKDGLSSAGFDSGNPQVIYNDFFLHYMGQGGKIFLDDRTASLAYYYGPLLKEDQGSFQGYWHTVYQDTLEVHGYGISLGYGFSSYLQGWVGFSDTLVGPAGSAGSSQQNLALGFDWVHTEVRMGALAIHQDASIHPYPIFTRIGKPETWTAIGYLGFLGGGHAPAAGEVAGNWNGFFDRQLQVSQYDIEDSLYRFSQEGAADQWILHGSARYGALEDFTIGLDYDVSFVGGAKSTFYLTGCLSTVPVRSKGPGQVSPLEYQLGILPKQGEGRLLTTIRLPGSEKDFWVTTQQLEGNVLASYASPWDASHRGWTHPGEDRAPFRATLLYGVSDGIFVTGSLTDADFYHATVGTSSYNLRELWGYSLGLGIHTDNFLLQGSMSYYVASVSTDPTNPNLPSSMSRFGPVQLQAIANF